MHLFPCMGSLTARPASSVRLQPKDNKEKRKKKEKSHSHIFEELVVTVNFKVTLINKG